VIRVTDPAEKSIPDLGLVHVKDAETGAQRWIDTGSRRMRTRYADWMLRSTDAADRLLMHHRVDHVDVSTDGDYVRPLMTLFHRR
ncbi:MAG: DUF58 domain-containing protein, partial [Bacteroidales bacterium]|nr:DUF58 domain-containing protein [Bacteroidales bacterium]